MIVCFSSECPIFVFFVIVTAILEGVCLFIKSPTLQWVLEFSLVFGCLGCLMRS